MARSAAALWFCVAVSRALAASSGEAKVLLRRRQFSRYCGSNPEQQQQAHCFRTEGYHRGLLTPASATAAASAPGACTSGTCSTGSCALTERTALGPPLSELRRPSSLTSGRRARPRLAQRKLHASPGWPPRAAPPYWTQSVGWPVVYGCLRPHPPNGSRLLRRQRPTDWRQRRRRPPAAWRLHRPDVPASSRRS